MQQAVDRDMGDELVAMYREVDQALYGPDRRRDTVLTFEQRALANGRENPAHYQDIFDDIQHPDTHGEGIGFHCLSP